MTRLLTTEHVKAMTKALKDTKMFKIEKTSDTVRVLSEKKGEVYAALKKGSSNVWIVRYDERLFV